MVQGDADMLQKLQTLRVSNSAHARLAVKEGASVLQQALHDNINESDKADTHMRDDVKIGSISDKTGSYEVNVGIGTETAWRYHYVDSGTIKQRPQNITEKAMSQSRDKVMEIYKKHMAFGVLK